jgi:hypothetical protein
MRAGATLEAAIIIPFLLVLLLGIIEFGMFLPRSLRLQAVAQQAALTLSKERDGPDADQIALRAIAGMARDAGVGVDRVIVYRVPAAGTGQVPAACLSASWTSSTSVDTTAASCNIYVGSEVMNLTPAAEPDPDLQPVAVALRTSANWWVPAERAVVANDRIGVVIQFRMPAVTGLFGGSYTLTERALFRFVPDPDAA